MEAFFFEHHNELLATGISLVSFFILRLFIVNAVRRVGKSGDLNYMRTRLVTKYFISALALILLVALILVWGVNIRELGLILSSVFAVLGVALFANWSILSNITAGIILFFYFPFKIGDRIKIQDKDFPEEAIIIDIKAFSISLVKDSGVLLTYPNNLILQKGVVILKKQAATEDDFNQVI